MKIDLKFIYVALVLTGIFIFLPDEIPDGYEKFLSIILFGTFLYIAVISFKNTQKNVACVALILSIIHNPFFIIEFSEDLISISFWLLGAFVVQERIGADKVKAFVIKHRTYFYIALFILVIGFFFQKIQERQINRTGRYQYEGNKKGIPLSEINDLVKNEQAQANSKELVSNKPSPNNITESTQNHDIVLIVQALSDTWLQVKSDEKIVYQMTLRKGVVERWQADDKIELSAKSMENLDLNFNGKNLKEFKSFNPNAKRLILTKDGID